jgi:hypothetical protein
VYFIKTSGWKISNLDVPRAGSEPGNGIPEARLASLSAFLSQILIAKKTTVPRHPNEGYLIQACQRRDTIQTFSYQF